MAKYVRKTHDEWHTQGNYGCGWETVTIDETYEEGKRMLRDYRENEPQYPHRLIKRRVRNDERSAENERQDYCEKDNSVRENCVLGKPEDQCG